MKLKLLLAALLLAVMTSWRYFFRRFEEANLYQPSRELMVEAAGAGAGIQDARFSAADGTRLHGWWAPVERPAFWVLLSHGNGGNVSHRLGWIALLRRLGAAVLVYDYRGYGKSEGRPDEAGTYQDAAAALAHLTGPLGADPARVVYLGESLGAAVAVELAVRRAPAGLILEAPFASTMAMAKVYFPMLPADLLVANRYDTLSKIGGLRAPLLVLHSREDDIVPFEQGLAVFEKAPGPKTLVDLRGGHNDAMTLSEAAAEEGLRAFLATLPTRGPR